MRDRQRNIRCNCTYNLRKIWDHRPQTQEHLYKILFVRFNNYENSLYSTSRNATVYEPGRDADSDDESDGEDREFGTYNHSVYFGTGVPEEHSSASTMMVSGVGGRQVKTFVAVPHSTSHTAHEANDNNERGISMETGVFVRPDTTASPVQTTTSSTAVQN